MFESEKDLRSPSFTTTDDPHSQQEEQPQPREEEKQPQLTQQPEKQEEFKEGGYGWYVTCVPLTFLPPCP
jgi:hypothetical protein